MELGNFSFFEHELHDLSSENKLEDLSSLFENDFPLDEVGAAPLDLCSRAAPNVVVHVTQNFL